MRSRPMIWRTTQQRNRGSILPLVALALVGLCGFVALAVDVGMLLVARTQCQNAADAAAMAGARTIDGSPSSNLTQATANAKSAAALNQILSRPVASSEVTV